MKITIDITAHKSYLEKYAAKHFYKEGPNKGKPCSLADAVNDLLVTAAGRQNALDKYAAKQAAKKNGKPKSSKGKKS